MSQSSAALHHPQPTAASRRWAAVALVTAGAMSALNGAAHFALPLVYPWQQHVEGLYEPVRWALFATTAFFALLLLFAGVLTIAVVLVPGVPPRVVNWIAGGMAVFWLVGAAYELAVPFPDPVVAWALPAFSIVVAGLHLFGLWLVRRPRRGRPRLVHRPRWRRTDALLSIGVALGVAALWLFFA